MIHNARIVGVGINPADYHKQESKRGTPEFIMSSSSLREFSNCPRRWLAGYSSPESDAKDFGSLLDTRLLTPGQFTDRYAIKPLTYQPEKGEPKKWNGNADVCREWVANMEAAGREIVSANDLAGADAAIKRLREDEIICAFLDCSDKQVHLKAEWQDENSGLTIPIQALLDLVPKLDSEFAKCAGDLKTTRNAAAMPWQRWCYQAGYYIQAAFFLDLLSAAEGGSDRNTFVFLISENYPPWETGKRMLNQDFLTLGREAYQRILRNYCACMKAGRWPGYDDHDEAVQSFTVVAAEPFMAERAMFAPKYDFTEAPEQTEEENEDDLPT